MRKRLIAPLALLLLIALVGVVGTLSRSDGGVRVQAGGDPTLMLETTTTQTPVTTPVPTAAPTTAPTTSTTVTPVTEPPTTAAPPTDPPTTEPPATSPPEQVAAQEIAPAEAPMPEVVQPDPAVKATRSGPVCTTDPEYCNPPTSPPRAQWQWCEEWHDLAAAVGWPESKGATLSFVMHRESGCDPNAYNPSGATGLLQIIGGCAPYGSCRDPEANLRRGLDMQESRGWQPWQVCGFSRNCNGRG